MLKKLGWVIATLLLGACRPTHEVLGCPRMLALTRSEREVMLILVAQPNCADAVTDSLLAPMEPAAP